VLLDRRRVKFWQKWVFGIMALLMAGFLIMIPISGQGCSKGQASASDSLKQDITRAVTATTSRPTDPQGWLDMGDAYLARARYQHVDGTAYTTAQTADLGKAAKAYREAADLLAKQKGATAKAATADALERLAQVYDTMGNYQKETNVFGQLTDLSPDNADYFFAMGDAARKAGDTANAMLAFQRFVDLAPDDPATPQVKAWIKQNAPTPTPAPTSTKGTGQ
jgi:tetratricopeptide (TPR) repeat protein